MSFLYKYIEFIRLHITKKSAEKNFNIIKFNIFFTIIGIVFFFFWKYFGNQPMSIVSLLFGIFGFVLNILHFYNILVYQSKNIINIIGSFSIIVLVSSSFHKYPLLSNWFLVCIIISAVFYTLKKSILLSIFYIFFYFLSILANQYLLKIDFLKISHLKYNFYVDIIATLVPFMIIYYVVAYYIRIINKEREKLLQTQKYKETFYAHISHEIRTPMNAIIGVSNVLKKTNLDTEQIKYVKTVETAANNLLVLLNDLLEISKIQAGKSFIEKKPFILTDTIQFVYQINKQLAKDKNISFDLNIDNEIIDQCIGDQVRLSQVLLNLISNAIKYTDKGSVSLNVKLVSKINDMQIISFSIKDTGIGIPKNFIKYIFEEFTQAENSNILNTKTNYNKGTGLGMSLSKMFIDLMGGEIYIESEENKGTEVRFILNFLLYQKEAVVLKKEDDKNNQILDLKNVNILIAEDNITNILVAKTILEYHGAKIFEANDGEEAIQVLKNNKQIQVILMDLGMPKLGGIEASKIIRNTINQSIPIIALTANSLPEEHQRCIEAGMNDFVLKPFNEKLLIELILKYLKN
jgi:signal transduction histidine kinase/CheY-like chemotaxis protein